MGRNTRREKDGDVTIKRTVGAEGLDEIILKVMTCKIYCAVENNQVLHLQHLKKINYSQKLSFSTGSLFANRSLMLM